MNTSFDNTKELNETEQKIEEEKKSQILLELQEA